MLWALLLVVLAAPDPVDEHVAVLKRHAKAPYEQREREKAIRALGKLGSVRAVDALVGLLEDPFSHIRDEAVSALIQLKRTPERAAALNRLGAALGKARQPGVRAHIATAFGLIGDRAAVPALGAALAKEKEPDAVAALAEALARLGGNEAREALLARNRPEGRAAVTRAAGSFPEAPLAPGESDDERAAYVDALARRGLPVWPDLKADDGLGVRLGIALADALAATNPPLAVRRATALLNHPSWRVRAAAIAGVRALRDPALLPALVDRLETERGRLRVDAWNALRALTGKDLPPVAADWRAVLPLTDLPEKGTATALPKSSANYFGLPVVSQRMAFVFDVSGSMRDDGKIEKARTAFAQTAAQLGKEQRYDLFVYRYYLKYPPRPKLERAFGKLTVGKSKTAARWLKKQEAKGAGAIYDALVAAIEDPDVDTIYLLSDGVPSFGTVKRSYRVLQELRKRNRFRRVVMHTILLGTKGTDKTFMKDLAAATGGVAVDAAGRRLG